MHPATNTTLETRTKSTHTHRKIIQTWHKHGINSDKWTYQTTSEQSFGRQVTAGSIRRHGNSHHLGDDWQNMRTNPTEMIQPRHSAKQACGMWETNEKNMKVRGNAFEPVWGKSFSEHVYASFSETCPRHPSGQPLTARHAKLQTTRPWSAQTSLGWAPVRCSPPRNGNDGGKTSMLKTEPAVVTKVPIRDKTYTISLHFKISAISYTGFASWQDKAAQVGRDGIHLSPSWSHNDVWSVWYMSCITFALLGTFRKLFVLHIPMPQNSLHRSHRPIGHSPTRTSTLFTSFHLFASVGKALVWDPR